jgi:hypothetical protein
MLEFPKIEPIRNGEEYGIALGGIGIPSKGNDIQVGPSYMQRVPTCVGLRGPDDSEVSHLSAPEVQWQVSVSPVDPSDNVTLTSPGVINSRLAEWTFTNGIELDVRFSDEDLVNRHQAALFIGGLLAGIGTGYLVQGLTGLRKTQL